jgi:ABC-type hemin transport system substrate-binding protein
MLKDFSVEAVIEQDPDFILVAPMVQTKRLLMANLKRQQRQIHLGWS